MKLSISNLIVSIVVVLISKLELLNTQSLTALLVKRQYHDGILYDDFAMDAPSVRYSINNGAGWENLDNLIEEEYLLRKAMFCSIGPGKWLLYPDANFGTGSRNVVKLINGEICVPAENVNSLQPLGSVNSNNEELYFGLVFSEKFFSSPVHTIQNGTEPPPIKSAIFMGEGMWTVTAGDKKICLSSIGKEGDICLMEDVEAAFEAPVTSIEKDCDLDGNIDEGGNGTDIVNEPDIEIYGLQSCYGEGYKEITYDVDLAFPGLQKICSGSYDANDPSKDKFYTIMNLWEKRMFGRVSSVQPVSGITGIKLGVVTVIEDIVDATCPRVSPEYLSLLSDLFVSIHLQDGKIWMDIPNNSSEYNNWERIWGETIHFLQTCLLQVESTGTEFNTECEPLSAAQMGGSTNTLAILEDFLNGESYDLVIEQFYLMFSFVSTFCYNTIGTLDNTWGELPLLLKEEFLYPLRQQWLKPGKWANYYPLIFSGYDLDKERNALIGCLQAVVLITPFYDPLARPEEFYTGFENTTGLGEGIGKATIGSAPGNKPADQRPKRQWKMTSMESEEENDIAGENPPPESQEDELALLTAKPIPVTSTVSSLNKKQKVVETMKTTTTASTTTTTTTVAPTTAREAVTETEAPSTTTEGPNDTEPEAIATKSKGKKKKGKKARKGKRNKKHSKLLRKKQTEASKKD